MKKYFLLLFAVFLLSSCTKNLQISSTKQPVLVAKKQQFPALNLQPKTVISPVFLQPLACSKMVLSSQNIYEQAYYQIRQILQGGKPLSFKKAVYLTENAYFDNELPENSFNQAITDLVTLTKAVEKTSKFTYKYADSVNLRKNYAIYRVLADTLNIANIFQLLPYEYDFEDARGEKEWAKGFVTKLLATRTGNCHSLPFLYKILAEELETEAYLSLLPHHIYLQIPFKRPPYCTQTYFNTELTSKTFPLDAWVETAGYVSNAAVVSGMYMDRLDTKQSIALCLVDLAKGFEARNKEKLSRAEIDQFMQNCVDLALQTAPNLITARLLQVELDKRNFVTTNNKLIYKQLEINITKLFADGYLELPELMYSEQPKTAGLDSTYTPFAQENIREGTPTGKGTVLTLSNGRYAEFKNAKRIETIGSVRFDTERKKIVGFGENKRQVEVVSRFLSVDPLAREFPWYTPYQFAGNKPINCIDLDGAEELNMTIQAKPANGEAGKAKLEIKLDYMVITQGLGGVSRMDLISAEEFHKLYEKGNTTLYYKTLPSKDGEGVLLTNKEKKDIDKGKLQIDYYAVEVTYNYNLSVEANTDINKGVSFMDADPAGRGIVMLPIAQKDIGASGLDVSVPGNTGAAIAQNSIAANKEFNAKGRQTGGWGLSEGFMNSLQNIVIMNPQLFGLNSGLFNYDNLV